MSASPSYNPFDELLALADDDNPTVGGHYGISKDDFRVMVADIIRDILISKSRSEVIDKHFKTFDNVARAKVNAYHIARVLADKVDEF